MLAGTSLIQYFQTAYKEGDNGLGELLQRSGLSDRFEMVARDGIEPPTPAFSGLPTNGPKSSRVSGTDSIERC